MTLRIAVSELVARAEASGSPGLVAKAPHWERVRLGEVARVVNGAAFKSNHFNLDGRGMPLLRIRDVGAQEVGTWYDGPWKQTHRVRRGDLVVGMDGDFKADTWKLEDALLNQRVCRIDIDYTRMDSSFLRLALPGYLDLIWQATSAVTVKHLSSRSIADIPLPLPDLREQRRVVEILEDHLSRLDAAAQYESAALRRADSLREELIRRAITGAEFTGERHPADLAEGGTQDGKLPTLPAEWRWQRLGEIADVVGGVTKDSKKQRLPGLVEVPYLRVANVQRGALRLQDVTNIRVTAEKAAALRLRAGDVLLNEGGDRDKLARGWVWQGEIPDCIHQNHVFRARLNVDLDPYFLSWTANTIGGRWAERNGKQSVNLASISLSKIRLMPVVVPPAGVSSAIVARLTAQLEDADRLQKAVRTSELRTTILRKAVLAAAFEGKLTGRHTDTEAIEELAYA